MANTTCTTGTKMCTVEDRLLALHPPDLILGQGCVQVAEDGLQIHCYDTHGHVLPELPGHCQVLHEQ